MSVLPAIPQVVHYCTFALLVVQYLVFKNLFNFTHALKHDVAICEEITISLVFDYFVATLSPFILLQ